MFVLKVDFVLDCLRAAAEEESRVIEVTKEAADRFQGYVFFVSQLCQIVWNPFQFPLLPLFPWRRPLPRLPPLTLPSSKGVSPEVGDVARIENKVR